MWFRLLLAPSVNTLEFLLTTAVLVQQLYQTTTKTRDGAKANDHCQVGVNLHALRTLLLACYSSTPTRDLVPWYLVPPTSMHRHPANYKQPFIVYHTGTSTVPGTGVECLVVPGSIVEAQEWAREGDRRTEHFAGCGHDVHMSHRVLEFNAQPSCSMILPL